MDKKEIIARRVARDLKEGYVVNLGIGLPTLVAEYVPQGISVIFHDDDGIMGMGPAPAAGQEDKDYFNASCDPVTVMPGAVFFDSATSFGIIRGGHVDVTVLGALQVDSCGNLANWLIPGVRAPGMGGAMDLVTGARRVIIAMMHTANGAHKILEACTYPLTAKQVVNRIVTDMAVIDVEADGLVLREMAPGVSVDEVQAATGARLRIDENLIEMQV